MREGKAGVAEQPALGGSASRGGLEAASAAGGLDREAKSTGGLTEADSGFGSTEGRGAGERLFPEHRLHKRSEYQRCYRTGRRFHGPLATLHFVPNQLEHPRIGITATRKVGPAVVRQRLKRRVREVYRRWSRRNQLPPRDLIVHLKPAAAEASFMDLRKELLRLLSRLLREGGRRVS